MRLVDDQRVILHQHAVLLDLRQQNTVGHQLNQGILAHLIAKAHLVADASSQRGLKLMSDTLGDRTRGQTTWLTVANHPAHATS